MKCSVFIATSVDGYIAKRDDDISWLFEPEYTLEDSSEDYGFKTFLASVDVIVMGRRTFDKVLTFDTWPYGNVHVMVVTSREISIPEALTGRVSPISGTPLDIVNTLERQGRSHAYIDGGVTIQEFLGANMIDEMTITRIPVLLGAGIPLFGSEGIEQRLKLVSSDAYPNGFVKSVYSLPHAST